MLLSLLRWVDILSVSNSDYSNLVRNGDFEEPRGIVTNNAGTTWSYWTQFGSAGEVMGDPSYKVAHGLQSYHLHTGCTGSGTVQP